MVETQGGGNVVRAGGARAEVEGGDLKSAVAEGGDDASGDGSVGITFETMEDDG